MGPNEMGPMILQHSISVNEKVHILMNVHLMYIVWYFIADLLVTKR